MLCYIVTFSADITHLRAFSADTIHFTEHTNIPPCQHFLHFYPMAINIYLATFNKPYGLFVNRLFLHCFTFLGLYSVLCIHIRHPERVSGAHLDNYPRGLNEGHTGHGLSPVAHPYGRAHPQGRACAGSTRGKRG